MNFRRACHDSKAFILQLMHRWKTEDLIDSLPSSIGIPSYGFDSLSCLRMNYNSDQVPSYPVPCASDCIFIPKNIFMCDVRHISLPTNLRRLSTIRFEGHATFANQLTISMFISPALTGFASPISNRNDYENDVGIRAIHTHTQTNNENLDI